MSPYVTCSPAFGGPLRDRRIGREMSCARIELLGWSHSAADQLNGAERGIGASICAVRSLDLPCRVRSSRARYLRSKPLDVSDDVFLEVFQLDDRQVPRGFIRNDFEDLSEVILDHATGLMWQKSGSDKDMEYKDTQAYVDSLNNSQFAGFSDWRLPTIPELMSLLEPDRQSNDLFINPIFDIPRKLYWCWSADTSGSRSAAWGVGFNGGHVDLRSLDRWSYVRVVRSLTN